MSKPTTLETDIRYYVIYDNDPRNIIVIPKNDTNCIAVEVDEEVVKRILSGLSEE